MRRLCDARNQGGVALLAAQRPRVRQRRARRRRGDIGAGDPAMLHFLGRRLDSARGRSCPGDGGGLARRKCIVRGAGPCFAAVTGVKGSADLELGYYRGTFRPKEPAKETVTMADRLDDTGSQPDAGRAKRAPPTIDLEANEVQTSQVPGESQEPPADEADEVGEPASLEPTPAMSAPAISPWVIAPVSGAVAAALVIGVGWLLGWPAIQAPPATPQVNVAAFEEIKTRLAGLESRVARPSAPDPATASRMDTTER